MTPTKTYIKELLAPRLKAHGLNKDQRAAVCADVEQRLASLLSRWADPTWRRTILLLGEEEATFWEPATARLDVRALVVLCIRNSIVEDLHASVRGRQQTITDAEMKELTREAIGFFESAALSEPTQPLRPDVFGGLAARFPNAWQALSTLANTEANETEYQLRKQSAEPVQGLTAGTKMPGRAVVASGMDPGIDTHLAAALSGIQKKAAEALTFPSFARLTRNPAKLLSILDHVLRHDGVFSTTNYAFATTFVARRRPLLRPPHDLADEEANHANTVGLTARHKEYLGID